MHQVIQPVHNPVFPVYDDLHDVIMEASYALDDGLLTTNHLRQLFGSYHNTLIAKMTAADQGKPQPPVPSG
jgi:hypothetical protein